MIDIERVWRRIERHAGENFRTITGLPFTYTVPGNYLRTSRTVRNLSRTNFVNALALMPAKSPVALKGLQGASCPWAILMDPRVREGDW
ncbi:hypothetical protein [Pengzhenrongella phosphoraccumulans]|uniref:hypothetical protein n=1 Tax=Pengzhenrongella phosphoraccumulans TaxID=3114394 RepID=UPI00388FDCFC